MRSCSRTGHVSLSDILFEAVRSKFRQLSACAAISRPSARSSSTFRIGFICGSSSIAVRRATTGATNVRSPLPSRKPSQGGGGSHHTLSGATDDTTQSSCSLPRLRPRLPVVPAMRHAVACARLHDVLARLQCCLDRRVPGNLFRPGQCSYSHAGCRGMLSTAARAAAHTAQAPAPHASVEDVLRAAYISLGRTAKPAELSSMVCLSMRSVALHAPVARVIYLL